MRRWLPVLVWVTMAVAIPVTAHAAVIYQDLLTVAPPGTLGGQVMTPFPLDGRPLFTNVTNVPSPLGGLVQFSGPANHRRIGAGWATWSHGYTGDVYFRSALTLTLTLPLGTTAFYFYLEPQQFQNFSFTVNADGTTATRVINGQAGARGFGFFGTDGSTINIITITTTDPTGFGIGEFGIAAVPEPSTLVLIGSGLVGMAVTAWRRRRRP